MASNDSNVGHGLSLRRHMFVDEARGEEMDPSGSTRGRKNDLELEVMKSNDRRVR